MAGDAQVDVVDEGEEEGVFIASTLSPLRAPRLKWLDDVVESLSRDP